MVAAKYGLSQFLVWKWFKEDCIISASKNKIKKKFRKQRWIAKYVELYTLMLSEMKAARERN